MLSRKTILPILCTLMLTMTLIENLYSANTITPRVDRKDIHQGESFKLTFTLEGTNNRSVTPDLSALEKDFTIVGNSTSTQMTVINGQSNILKKWTLVLFTNKTGRITIPAMQFANQSSAAITLNIRKRAERQKETANQNIFIDTSTDSQNPHVQQQIIYTVRLYYSANILNYHMTNPQSNSAVIFTLGQDRQYQTEKNGKDFRVLERRFAIFPQRSGVLEIESPILTGYEQEQTAHYGSFINMPQDLGKPIRLALPNKKIMIQSIPKNFPSKQWLPAKKLKLTQNWTHDSHHFTVGEPITRTLTITATGLTAAQLPEVELKVPDNAHAYRDKAQLVNKLEHNNVIAMRTEKIAYIPTKDGKFTIPSLKVPWYNSASNSIEIASLPGKSFNIRAGHQQISPRPKAATINADTESPLQPASPKRVLNSAPIYWQWILISTLGIGWLGTSAAWYKQRRKITSQQTMPLTTSDISPTQNTSAKSERYYKKQLQTACQHNKPAQAKSALLQIAKHRWPAAEIHNLQTLCQKAENPLLLEQLKTLDETLYRSEKPSSWRGEALWEAVRSAAAFAKPKNLGPTSIIPPLYPPPADDHD